MSHDVARPRVWSLLAGCALAVGVTIGCGTGASEQKTDETADMTVAGAPPPPVRLMGETKYHEFWDDQMPDGRVIIESDPPGAQVFLVKGLGDYFSVGTTPCVYYCKASGVPYAFMLELRGFLDMRVDARPMPDNPAVKKVVRMHADFASPFSPIQEPEAPASPYATLPEERNLNYFESSQMHDVPDARGSMPYARHDENQVAPTGRR